MPTLDQFWIDVIKHIVSSLNQIWFDWKKSNLIYPLWMFYFHRSLSVFADIVPADYAFPYSRVMYIWNEMPSNIQNKLNK